MLEELFEVYRGYFLKALDFGQNAVNPCVETFDVVAHFGLAHFFAKLPLIERSGHVALVSATASRQVRKALVVYMYFQPLFVFDCQNSSMARL